MARVDGARRIARSNRSAVGVDGDKAGDSAACASGRGAGRVGVRDVSLVAPQQPADQIASVLEAAQSAADQLRLEAEGRVRSRIAEGERAAELRVSAAEEEAAEILGSAR